MDESYGLRVAVMGGGCSGFQYALDFEKEGRETDETFEVDGLKVFVDPVSARYLEDVVIDGASRRYLAPAGFRTRTFPAPDARMRITADCSARP